MVEARSETLVDEGGVVVAYYPAKDGVGLSELQHVAGLEELPDVFLSLKEKPQEGHEPVVCAPVDHLRRAEVSEPFLYYGVCFHGSVGKRKGGGRVARIDCRCFFGGFLDDLDRRFSIAPVDEFCAWGGHGVGGDDLDQLRGHVGPSLRVDVYSGCGELRLEGAGRVGRVGVEAADA